MPSGLDHPNPRSRSAVSLDFLIRLYIGIAYACNNLLPLPLFPSLIPIQPPTILNPFLSICLSHSDTERYTHTHTHLAYLTRFMSFHFHPEPISVFSSRVIIRCIVSAFCVSYLLVIAGYIVPFIYRFRATRIFSEFFWW